MPRNSLSNSPCPLGSARGRCRYNLLARAMNNKPFQCSDERNSSQRRRSAARVEQGDMFKFYALSRSLISARLRNSLSNFQYPLGSARGRGLYNLLARAIKNKPFRCSDGRDSPQLRRSAARVEQGDMFKFYARSRSLMLLIPAQFW